MTRTPVLLLAGHDLNVDVTDTENVYRATVAGLEVRHYPHAAHNMISRDVAESDLWTLFRAVFTPRSLFVAGFLDDQRRYLLSLPH